MSPITLDHLSGRRFILGLGASGPQVVEGWYGQPYPKPLARTREYVEIVRSIVAREQPVEFHGEFYDMPFQGGAGLGKALKSTVHPLRNDIPIYLAAEGPKNVALSAEICDGWLPLFFSPKEDGWYREQLRKGFEASGEPGKADRFEVSCGVMVIPGDDAEKAAESERENKAPAAVARCADREGKGDDADHERPEGDSPVERLCDVRREGAEHEQHAEQGIGVAQRAVHDRCRHLCRGNAVSRLVHL